MKLKFLIIQLAVATAIALSSVTTTAASLLTNEPSAEVVKHENNSVLGQVIDAKTQAPIPGATVIIKNSRKGSTTDANGQYTLTQLPAGKFTLVVRSIGYQTEEFKVVLKENQNLEINFALKEDAMNLDEVVVSSNRQKTLRRYAPTLVSILDEKLFSQSNAVNLAQGLSFQPGIRVENSCQNCCFNQVLINGLDGHFSQILIDSRPVVSALAAVYGLEMIPANMIDRVEVVRGGGSALYGSSAIAGVINIITKEPLSNSFSFHENMTLTGLNTPDNTIAFNASMVTDNHKAGAMIFGQTRERKPWDANNDGFSEIGNISARSLGTRAFYKINDLNKLTAEYFSIHEYRRGGDHIGLLPDNYASIAERTRHLMHSGNVKYEWRSEDRAHDFQAYASAQLIDRTSFYGGIGDQNLGSLGHPTDPEAVGREFGFTKGQTAVAGAQYSWHSDHFLFMPFELLVGTEYMFDRLKDFMPIRQWDVDSEGKTLFPTLDQRIHNISQIAQAEWKNEEFTVLAGARLDEHSFIRTQNGNISPIISPRVTLRWNPAKEVNLRTTYSKGFRAPQVFDEDLHISMVQGEPQRVTNAVGLKPEYSHSFSVSSDMYFNTSHVQSNILVEAFYTRLLGAFNNEKRDSRDGFSYMERVNGSGASIFGVNLEAKLMIHEHVSIQGGLTLSKNLWDSPQGSGVERSLLVGETEENYREINTLTEAAPSQLNEFATNQDGEYINVELQTKEYLRTPNIYGYLTINYSPIKALSLSTTLNYTGSMLVPHAIEYGRNSAVIDREAIVQGKREQVADDADAPAWGVINKSPSFFELGLRASYTFDLFKNSQLEFYLGGQNLLNSFQKDFDYNGFRDSAYIYGPTMPRTIYTGLVFKM